MQLICLQLPRTPLHSQNPGKLIVSYIWYKHLNSYFCGELKRNKNNRTYDATNIGINYHIYRL